MLQSVLNDMEFSVTILSQGLVTPSGPTPSGVLELSVVDRLPALRCNVRTLHVFRQGGPQAAQIIREALSKALIPYYPLAGRLHFDSVQNKLQIACSAEGVWFADAKTDCTLDSVHYFEDTVSIPYDKLLPIIDPSQEHTDPLVQMQVTKFRCGGFVIGLIFCHSICDGLGAAQFLNAVGEMAKGADQLSINPEWCRDFLTPHSSLTPPDIPLMPNIPSYKLQHATIDVSMDRIKDLKQEFQEPSGGETTCSTFEVVAALLWRNRTLAINLDDRSTPLKLVFFANCRQLITGPPLPKGFYGNCFFPVTVTATCKMLTSSSMVDVIKLIQEAKSGLPNQFAKWVAIMGGEGGQGSGPDPFAPPLEYTTLFISEWGRLGFNQVDYGWGNPVHVVPIQGSSIIPVGIVCYQPSPKTGVRLMTWCVHQTHLQPLFHHINTIFTN